MPERRLDFQLDLDDTKGERIEGFALDDPWTKKHEQLMGFIKGGIHYTSVDVVSVFESMSLDPKMVFGWAATGNDHRFYKEHRPTIVASGFDLDGDKPAISVIFRPEIPDYSAKLMLANLGAYYSYESLLPQASDELERRIQAVGADLSHFGVVAPKHRFSTCNIRDAVNHVIYYSNVLVGECLARHRVPAIYCSYDQRVLSFSTAPVFDYETRSNAVARWSTPARELDALVNNMQLSRFLRGEALVFSDPEELSSTVEMLNREK